MKVCFLADIFCPFHGTVRVWPNEIVGDVCVLNYEYVSRDAEVGDMDAAPGKLNLYGEGHPFLPKGFKRYIACVANNHALDFMDRGVDSTLRVFDRHGVSAVGLNLLPNFVEVGERSGVTISAYCQDKCITNVPAEKKWHINELREEDVLRDAQAARMSGSRFHVVYLHWGTEYLPKPWPNQIEIAHRLIDSGAVDLIIGMHSHCLQPYEVYKGKYIFYGNGNCVFPNYSHMPSHFHNGQAHCAENRHRGEYGHLSLAVILDTNNYTISPIGLKYEEHRSRHVVFNAPPPQSADELIVREVDLLTCAWRWYRIAFWAFLCGDFGAAKKCARIPHYVLKWPTGVRPKLKSEVDVDLR